METVELNFTLIFFECVALSVYAWLYSVTVVSARLWMKNDLKWKILFSSSSTLNQFQSIRSNKLECEGKYWNVLWNSDDLSAQKRANNEAHADACRDKSARSHSNKHTVWEFWFQCFCWLTCHGDEPNAFPGIRCKILLFFYREICCSADEIDSKKFLNLNRNWNELNTEIKSL